MIILLWVRVYRCVGPHHRGPNVHKVASSPSEKSELRHIGSSPPEKEDFGSGDVEWLGTIKIMCAGNWCTACQRQRLRDRWVCRNATGANPSSLPSNRTVTSRCSRRLALPICGRSFSGQLDRRLSLDCMSCLEAVCRASVNASCSLPPFAGSRSSVLLLLLASQLGLRLQLTPSMIILLWVRVCRARRASPSRARTSTR